LESEGLERIELAAVDVEVTAQTVPTDPARQGERLVGASLAEAAQHRSELVGALERAVPTIALVDRAS
jgi:hypothetical protein